MTSPPTEPAPEAADSPTTGPDGGRRWRPWLHLYCIALVAATFVLIFKGGRVTSLDAGLAVPDWPGTFGYNMFLAPLDVWYHETGTFVEHSHRLLGSLVGMLTIGLLVWAWVGRRERPGLFKLALVLLPLVILQGLMGGFRVTEQSRLLAGVHGVVGQLFLGLTVLAAAMTGAAWHRLRGSGRDAVDSRAATRPGPTPSPAPGARGDTAKQPAPVRHLAVALLVFVIVQLILGAAVRHAPADRAIPDWPLHLGSIIPPVSQAATDARFSELIGADRVVEGPLVWQVWLQLAHRVGAYVLSGFAVFAVIALVRRLRGRVEVIGPVLVFAALLSLQVLIGVSVVLTDTDPSIATLHQTIGATLLATVTWLTIRVYLVTVPTPGGATRRAASPRVEPGRATATAPLTGQPA